MKEFDELLDGVLQQEGQVEPLVGLEERVMARARLSVAPRPKRFIAWWYVAAAIPMSLVVLLLWPKNTPQRGNAVKASLEQRRVKSDAGESRSDEPGSKMASQRKVSNERSQSRTTELVAAVPAPGRRPALPKLDVFPSPSSPTEQMQALLEVAQQDPNAMMREQTEDDPKKPPTALKVEPITIASIEIEPLYPLPDRSAEKLKGDRGR
jgi:hypothetical protein